MKIRIIAAIYPLTSDILPPIDDDIMRKINETRDKLNITKVFVSTGKNPPGIALHYCGDEVLVHLHTIKYMVLQVFEYKRRLQHCYWIYPLIHIFPLRFSQFS